MLTHESLDSKTSKSRHQISASRQSSHFNAVEVRHKPEIAPWFLSWGSHVQMVERESLRLWEIGGKQKKS